MAVYSGDFAKWVQEGRDVSDAIFQHMLSASDPEKTAIESIQELLQDKNLFPDRPQGFEAPNTPDNQLRKAKAENPLEQAVQDPQKDLKKTVNNFQLAIWHDACARAQAGTQGPIPIARILVNYRLEMKLLEKADTSGRLKYAQNPYMQRAEMLAKLETSAHDMDQKLAEFKTKTTGIGAAIIGAADGNLPSLDDTIKIIRAQYEKHQNETNPDSPKDALLDLNNRLVPLQKGIEALQDTAKDINNPAKQKELEAEAQKLQNELNQINQTLNSEHTRNILQRAYQTEDDNKKLQAFLTNMQYLQFQIEAVTKQPITTKIDRNLYDKDPPSLLDVEESKIGMHGIFYYENVAEYGQPAKHERRTMMVDVIDKNGNRVPVLDENGKAVLEKDGKPKYQKQPLELTKAELDETARLAEKEIKQEMKNKGDLKGADKYKIDYSSNWFGKGGTYHTHSADNAKVFRKHMEAVYEKRPAPQQAAVVQQAAAPAAAPAQVQAAAPSPAQASGGPAGPPPESPRPNNPPSNSKL